MTTETKTFFAITAPSAIDLRVCILGVGETPAAAWADAGGRNRRWICRECDEEMFFSGGQFGKITGNAN